LDRFWCKDEALVCTIMRVVACVDLG